MEQDLIIAPSFFSSMICRMNDTIKIMEKNSLEWIHIDVMDGHFVPNMSSGPHVVSEFHNLTNLKLDVHLMVEKPERVIESFIEAGADLITYHTEATSDDMYIIQTIKKSGVKAGVAINPGTSVESILPILDIIDCVLVMTANPGRDNQEFILKTLEKIEVLQRYKDNQNLNFIIEVDGKIEASNIKEVANKGASMFVSGGYLFSNDDLLDEKIKTLKKEIE